jgi:hypothetical protein
MQSGTFQATGSGSGAVAFQTSVLPADGSGWLLISQQTGDSQWRVLMNASGTITWGSGAAPGDTRLYRSGVNVLTTDGALIVGTTLYAGNGIVVDNANAGSKLFFGAALDTQLYRQSAQVLATNSRMRIGDTLAGQVDIGAIGVGSAAAIYFGVAADTNLYRSSAGVLKTDSIFYAQKVGVQMGTANQILTEADGRIYFGSAADVNLYRSAANSLKTDGHFVANLNIYLDQGNAGNRLIFGSAGDIYLYRSAAGVLKTDGQLQVGSAGLQVGGVLDRSTALVDIQNSTVEQSLYSKVIPAGAMGIDKMLRLTMLCDLLYNSSGNNLTIKIKFGGVTIFSDVFNQGVTDAARRPFILNIWLANCGAANSQMMSAQAMNIRIADTHTPTTGLGGADFRNIIFAGLAASLNALATVDTTVAQTLDITAQWSAAGTTLSIRKRYASLEVV